MTQSSNAGNAQDDPLVLVGEITGPFGVRGQLKMHPLMDEPKTLTKLTQVTVRYPNGGEQSDKVTAVSPHGGAWLLRLDGVPDRNAAETMRDCQVLIRRSQLPPLEEDAYYEHQLIGLHVLTESGKDLGTIEKVHFYPANDVYETSVAMIPAVADIIVRVDLAAGEMRVQDRAGLRKDE